MKTGTHKKKIRETGEDLWSWAERREAPAMTVREESPATPQTGWYLGILKKIAGQKG